MLFKSRRLPFLYSSYLAACAFDPHSPFFDPLEIYWYSTVEQILDTSVRSDDYYLLAVIIIFTQSSSTIIQSDRLTTLLILFWGSAREVVGK